ncbi:fungal-specific transcription factor [Xylariaceae sp. FL1272]|nr:fungal-specific transcription factor [Xylariaceae sp. FL1272]
MIMPLLFAIISRTSSVTFLWQLKTLFALNYENMTGREPIQVLDERSLLIRENSRRSSLGREYPSIWNVANETLYSEIHLNPGIFTITAVLLNVGGRPTTSLIGNGVLLGAAISLAHSLGLNRNPLNWDIPDAEKLSRMKIWWDLLIHDKWSNLAYGTPSHVTSTHHDVPPPCMQYLESTLVDQCSRNAAQVFIAFFGLTDTVDYEYCLYCLNHWIETLSTETRQIITRGTNLDLPGAANLRFAYLSMQLLLRRITLEVSTEKEGLDSPILANLYMQVRRTAEDIVILVQELTTSQLGDFWLPVRVFIFASATTSLLRCALKTVDSVVGLARSSSVHLAWDLIQALKAHRDNAGWDLGDICLAQHAEVVKKLMNGIDTDCNLSIPNFQDMVTSIPDVSFPDDLLPGLWNTL